MSTNIIEGHMGNITQKKEQVFAGEKKWREQVHFISL